MTFTRRGRASPSATLSCEHRAEALFINIVDTHEEAMLTCLQLKRPLARCQAISRAHNFRIQPQLRQISVKRDADLGLLSFAYVTQASGSALFWPKQS